MFFSGTIRDMAAVTVRDLPVSTESAYDRAAPAVDNVGQVRMIICAIDYKKTKRPLTCTLDGNNIQELAKDCGVEDVTVLYDEQCTSANVERVIGQVGARCQDEDYFVFYYSGHGSSVEDTDFDEADGMDEAFCFVDMNGQLNRHTKMLDDDFARIVTDALPEKCRALVLTDCCHSASIADLDKECWKGREAISIAGCLDEETSGDIGRGGIFTHAMLLAIDKLQESELEDYSVGMLYNATLLEDERIFHSAQNITMQYTAACEPNAMAWPLVPLVEDYEAPLKKMALAGGINPWMWGVNPAVAGLIENAAGITAHAGQGFVSAVRKPASLFRTHPGVLVLLIVCLFAVACLIGLISIWSKASALALAGILFVLLCCATCAFVVFEVVETMKSNRAYQEQLNVMGDSGDEELS